MRWFILAEDLVGALIGPFASFDEALAHVDFCENRGDAATTRIITEDRIPEFRDLIAYTLTPQADRDYAVVERPK